MNAAEKILIVEDDAAIAEILRNRLSREGFEVQWAADGKMGYEAVQTFHPSLILLDLTMPQMNGIEVCRRLREKEDTRQIPIIMVTANSEDADITIGLELGADDYVAKPFSLRQLVARIRAVLRRAVNTETLSPAGASSDSIQLSGIEMNYAKRELKLNGENITLTLTEFELLWNMVKDPGKIFSREEFLERLQKQDGSITKRNIDVHVMTLRKKMGEDGSRISTVRGLGYKIR